MSVDAINGGAFGPEKHKTPKVIAIRNGGGNRVIALTVWGDGGGRTQQEFR
jgi:hypothetical protein